VTTTHVEEPDLPEGITPGELDDEARRDLRGLQKDTADVVAKHLVAAGMLVDEDPEQALAHARYARRRASRIAVVREAAGIVAYHAGEWNEALGELRAARRMGGGPGHLAVMADIERALGRPERALELVRAPEAKELGKAETIELAIVAAGARRDLGELDAAVVGLQIPELEPTRREPWSPRLFYAYADNLLAAGRESDALQWFVHTVDADVEGETDAAARIAELTGEPLEDDGVTFQGEDLLELETDDEAGPEAVTDDGASTGGLGSPKDGAVADDAADVPVDDDEAAAIAEPEAADPEAVDPATPAVDAVPDDVATAADAGTTADAATTADTAAGSTDGDAATDLATDAATDLATDAATDVATDAANDVATDAANDAATGAANDVVTDADGEAGGVTTTGPAESVATGATDEGHDAPAPVHADGVDRAPTTVTPDAGTGPVRTAFTERPDESGEDGR